MTPDEHEGADSADRPTPVGRSTAIQDPPSTNPGKQASVRGGGRHPTNRLL